MAFTIPRTSRCALSGALLALLCLADARAEHADRTRETAVTANDATADHAHQTADFRGDVVVSQGTLEIRPDRVQMRLGVNGERQGSAFGKAGAPVRFRQRGDRPGEWSEGEADRVEYDSLVNEVRLIGAASLRNLDGALVTQSIDGETIVYDTARDTLTSTGATRRVRIVFAPTVAAVGDAAAAR